MRWVLSIPPLGHRMFIATRPYSFRRSALLRQGLRLVWRIVLRRASTKAEQNQSCCGVASRRGWPMRDRDPERSTPRAENAPSFDHGEIWARHRLCSTRQTRAGSRRNWCRSRNVPRSSVGSSVYDSRVVPVARTVGSVLGGCGLVGLGRVAITCLISRPMRSLYQRAASWRSVPA